MKCWFLLFGLAVAALLIGGCSSEKGGANKVEIRAALNAPQPGCTKATVEGTGETIYLAPEAALTGLDVKSAELLPTRQGPAVGVTFTKAGGEKLARFMAEHKGKRMAILVDGRVSFAPPIGPPIKDGKMLIGGAMTQERAAALAEAFASAAGK